MIRRLPRASAAGGLVPLHGARMHFIRYASVGALAGLLLGLPARPAAAQWQIESKDGKSNIKIGFLVQPQAEVVDTPDGAAESRNIYLRRIRIMFGGKVADRWTFFFETDSPNVGKATGDKVSNPNGAKDTGPIYIQDAYVTYSQADWLKVDTGMILIPLGHNHNQSAATLLAVDYGPYSCSENSAIGARLGRDYGVQARGYPLGQHLEYRLGVFAGLRGTEARNSLRVAGRAVWYPFAADNGFFYSGTFQGSKQIVGIGAGFDTEDDYHSYAADVFVEQPINKGAQGFTAQVGWMRFDGGAFMPNLPKQDSVFVEAGFHFLNGKLSPLAQYSRRTFEDPGTPGQSAWQAGIAYWMAGHQRNLKVTAGRLHTDGQPGRTQVLVQLQLFYF
jgi:hypothetical protein